jgi:hypothetical protein
VERGQQRSLHCMSFVLAASRTFLKADVIRANTNTTTIMIAERGPTGAKGWASDFGNRLPPVPFPPARGKVGMGEGMSCRADSMAKP